MDYNYSDRYTPPVLLRANNFAGLWRCKSIAKIIDQIVDQWTDLFENLNIKLPPNRGVIVTCLHHPCARLDNTCSYNLNMLSNCLSGKKTEDNPD